MVSFKPNRKFKRKYDRLFKKNPLSANTLLLLCELADKNGQVVLKSEEEMAVLLAARFEDPEAHQL